MLTVVAMKHVNVVGEMALALVPLGRSETLSSFQSNMFPEWMKMSWFSERLGGEKRKDTGENGES